jgi:actin-related protein
MNIPNIVGIIEDKTYIGEKAYKKIKELKEIESTIRKHKIKNKESFEKILKKGLKSEDFKNLNSILVTESILTKNSERKYLAELLFEKYNFEYVTMLDTSMLGLYSIGKTRGIAVDSGTSLTTICYFDNVIEKKSIEKIKIGGKQITEYLQKLLEEKEEKISLPFYICNDIKEKHGRIKIDSDNIKITYKLPDGEKIKLGNELKKCTEVLFKPSILDLDSNGIHKVIEKTINTYNCNDTLIFGGNTLFFNDGIKTRLEREIKLKLTCSSEREISAWIGGSIYASLSSFHINNPMIIKKGDFNDDKYLNKFI